MQFRRAKGRVQVLAYRGYDKEKKRAIVKMLGSLDAYSLEPTDTLLNELTDDEKTELQSYIKTSRQDKEKASRLYYSKQVAVSAASAADCIAAGELDVTEDYAIETWSAIDRLTRALRRNGWPKAAALKALEKRQRRLPGT